MFKKTACYLSVCLIAAPLVALAEELPVAPAGPVQQALAQLPSACPGLAKRLEPAAQQRLQALYQQQGDQLLWTATVRQAALQTQLDLLADDGLNPADYRPIAVTTADNGVCADLQTTGQYLQALQDLRYGRVSQARFEPIWHASEEPHNREAEVLAIAGPGLLDIAAAFELARPSLELYRQLRQVYARQRLQPLPQWPTVAGGPLLRPQMQDGRVPVLAQRLFDEGYLSELNGIVGNQYGGQVLSAVMAFQRNHSLQADGVIGPGTLAELNISPLARRDQLRANLERFRWLARDIEPSGLLVNVAAAQLNVYQDGQLVWQTRTQVGRADRQTPLLKSRVTRLTLNPTWTIPPTILREDKLPAIRQDPAFLSKHDLQVFDAAGQPLSAQDVDWRSPGNIILRQGAGPRNPLGQMAIRFPNPFSVYLHDTPSQALFSKGPRAFSSGCVRVEHALQLRDLLLTPAERARTDELLATGKTHEFRLAKPVPILLAYWTAQADGQGGVIYSPDIYARDAKLAAALIAAQ